jgi:hypothetical protein
MASIITATTTSGLTQSADNSGVLQLASGTGNLVTVPSVTGTAMVSGNMPAFSAYLSATQTPITNNTFTKLQANTEEFDTANCYDNATNYRFTPNVAGYYQISGCITFGSTAGSFNGNTLAVIYKNGSRFKDGNLQGVTANGGTLFYSVVSSLIYFNGSTDYVELWGLGGQTGTLSFNSNSGTQSYFQGALVRAA